MKVSYLNIDQLAVSGQTFRWYSVSEGYLVVHKDQAMHIRQDGSDLDIKALTEGPIEAWHDYLDLQRDYKAIRSRLYGKNTYLDAAMTCGQGIRLLNQDAYEMVITFMISANNNMKRIKDSVFKLCQGYGKLICHFEGKDYYSFPSIYDLRALEIKDYRACGVGYRDKYLYEFVQEALGGLDVDAFHAYDDEDLKTALMKIKGIGEKVANCVLLFGYHRRHGFPIDTWIKKVLVGHFNVQEKDLKDFSKTFFPEEGGLAQQYLFYYGAVEKK